MDIVEYQNTKYYLLEGETNGQKLLCIEGDASGFHGEFHNSVHYCPLSPENASTLRERLPWLKPQPLGLATSFGFGDRLGLATPGHLSSMRDTGIAPIFAQQSVRENARTGRTPQIVLDDAMWAVFEHGWRYPWGADADHVKEIADLPPFIEAGYSFYTIDPNQYVDNNAQTDRIEILKKKVLDLPWESMKITVSELREHYLNGPIELDGITLSFSDVDLMRALAKYGQAITHIKEISDYLVEHVAYFDLEASVDETDTPTSVQEHYFIAHELRRLQVPIVSLAPRFIGSFEKGVDYIGDITKFESEFARHALIMRAVGDYKMSIHTGSDKFNIYPVIAHHTGNSVHVKTAGTSYLEALKVIATVDPTFFREILDFSRGKYEADKATYHVSGNVEMVPSANDVDEPGLLRLFDQFDARQVLHVTFGSVLDEYGIRLKETLSNHLDCYNEYLQHHFWRHLSPFIHHSS